MGGGEFGGESGYHIQNLNEFDCLEYSNEGGVRVKKICYWEGEVKVIYYSTKTSGLYIPGLFSNHRCSLIGVVLNSPLYTVNCCD